jgi:hypothetical protein
MQIIAGDNKYLSEGKWNKIDAGLKNIYSKSLKGLSQETWI